MEQASPPSPSGVKQTNQSNNSNLLTSRQYGAIVSIAANAGYGGEAQDQAASIEQTIDGGFIVAGTTESKGAGLKDIWVVKVDANGALLWDKTYGGEGAELAGSIVMASDEGFVVAGSATSKGAGKLDFWILRLDKFG